MYGQAGCFPFTCSLDARMYLHICTLNSMTCRIYLFTPLTVWKCRRYLCTTNNVDMQNVSLCPPAMCMPPHCQLCKRVPVWFFFFHLSTVFYAVTPDCSASDHSSTGMKKNADAGTGQVPELGNPIRYQNLWYRTEILNAGMPMPAALASMQQSRPGRSRPAVKNKQPWHRYGTIRFGFPGQIKKKNMVRIENDFRGK